MDLEYILKSGLSREENFLVAEEQAAVHIGSGGTAVLATPWLIAFMERVAFRLLEQYLPDGSSSVGILVNVRHLAPTPVGKTVRVRVAITAVEGSKVTFTVQAWDQQEQIGEGEHQRAVIDVARFLRRVEAKG